ncbi:hypothetical protein ABZX75_16525 [Streptomyces sp. NPDC003038]|uniref:hypothetical protein n=1 Tax=unclassified Streptomyces TaxID=2593676 RepID=UPI0033B857C3
MHAPGLPPQHGPQPSTGGVVALRVLFALLPVLSCGFLAWGTMLRLAILTRKPRDWALLVLVSVLSVSWLALIGADPTPDTNGWQGNTGAGGVILTGLVTCVYFLYSDIRHHEARAAARSAHWYPQGPAPYGVPQQTTQGYGYPPAPQQQTRPSHQAPAQPPHQVPAQPPQPTAPPRIGQVRAELDELSELLRKQTPHPRQPPREEDPHR